jgi:hypothetical protein
MAYVAVAIMLVFGACNIPPPEPYEHPYKSPCKLYSGPDLPDDQISRLRVAQHIGFDPGSMFRRADDFGAGEYVLVVDERPYVLPMRQHRKLECDYMNNLLLPGRHSVHLDFAAHDWMDPMAQPLTGYVRLEFEAKPGHVYELAIVVGGRPYTCQILDETVGEVVALIQDCYRDRAAGLGTCEAYAACGNEVAADRLVLAVGGAREVWMTGKCEPFFDLREVIPGWPDARQAE